MTAPKTCVFGAGFSCYTAVRLSWFISSYFVLLFKIPPYPYARFSYASSFKGSPCGYIFCPVYLTCETSALLSSHRMPPSLGLEDLPFDVFFLVASYLTLYDIVNLAKTSGALCQWIYKQVLVD